MVRVNARGQVRPRIYNQSATSIFSPKRARRDEYVSVATSATGINLHTGHDDVGDEPDEGFDTDRAGNHEINSTGVADVHAHVVEHDNFTQHEGTDSQGEDTVDTGNIADETHSDGPSGCDHMPPNGAAAEEVNLEEKEDAAIYEGHTLSVHTSLMLIWVYAMVHSITGVQLADLLTLVSLHCLHPHPLLSSLKRFRGYFASLKSPLVKHYLCNHCTTPVNSTLKTCPNTFCSNNLLKPGGKSYYIEFPILDQVTTLFQREEFISGIQKRFSRKKKGANCIEDIYDGAIYKEYSKPGGLLSERCPYNISLTWNTDGIPLFKSSKMSIWPVYLIVNELPWHMRKKKENLLFYGLWFGDSKPLMTAFLQPLHSSLNTLEKEGLDVVIKGEKRNIKAFLLCGTADLPARALVLNMNQFNGQYSCVKCLQRGETCRVSLRGFTHVYPYCKDNPVGPCRKDAFEHASSAVDCSKAVMGVKGPSFLMMLNAYNYTRSTGIDYMHGVILGVTKRLLSLWFTADGSGKSFSLQQFVEVVDERLKKIKPPHFITRRPRSISEHMKYWKASELRAWLLFYSLPVLKDIMRTEYFVHYASFVEAIWILLDESISEYDLDKCTRLLHKFVLDMESPYGLKYCTLNIHQCLHLPDCVRDLGPLWVYSCFHFESLNGDLLKLFHGTQSVQTQIVAAVNMHQMLPNTIKKIPADYQKVSFVKRLSTKKVVSSCSEISPDVYGLGHSKKRLKDCIYDRIILQSRVYHSVAYKRVEGRNSYTVKYLLDTEQRIHYGYVKYYKVEKRTECNCHTICSCTKMVMAVISRLDEVSTVPVLDRQSLGVQVNHIRPCTTTNVVDEVDVHHILTLCVEVNIGKSNDDLVYVCEAPNRCESD